MPRHRHRTTIVAALLLLSAPAAAARAQSAADAGALPFHAGQWGLSANVTGLGAGIGALRFTAPARAVVFEASASLRNEERSVTAGPFTPESSEDFTTGSVSLSLGLRRFRPIASAVALFNTFGVDGQYQGGGGSTPHSWGAGLFGDLGAQYMLDPHFSLGIAAGLRAGYTESRSSYGGGQESRLTYMSLSTTPARFMGTVYF